jgi:hypothetical protein
VTVCTGQSLGFYPTVLLLEAVELEAAAANNPFPTKEGMVR